MTRMLCFYRPHDRIQLDCGTEQVTKQSHKDECDINYILSQYQRTGILNHVNTNRPLYTDLPDSLDYQSALHLLQDAQASFSSLPAAVRDHFANDPAKFLAAFNDPSQLAKLQEFGLLKSQPAKAAEAADTINS